MTDRKSYITLATVIILCRFSECSCAGYRYAECLGAFLTTSIH